MSDPNEICARLIREGTIPKRELADLDTPETRTEVERRLRDVGLILATSAYSEDVGIRLAPEVIHRPPFDFPSNLGLRSDACALLAILWFRLVLRKRTAIERRKPPGQASLLAEDQASAAADFAPEVRLETIYREFGSILGSRTNIRRLVSQLRNLRFIEVRAGRFLRPGPLLELGVDGEAMMGFVRTRVLGDLLKRASGSDVSEGPLEPEEQLLSVLLERGGTLRMSTLVEATGKPAERLRPLLRNLIEEGKVEKIGERGDTRYRYLSSNPPSSS
jgi:hypothetical protein